MSKYNVESIKEIPIQEVLEDFYGITCQSKGNHLWCAIRNEKTPSCRIYPDTNTWCDFGDGNRGGNVITLVQHLDHIEWKDAVKKLGGYYSIQQEYPKQYDKFPSSREFKDIHIAFERSTLNFDFQIEKYGLKKTQEFAQKYSMNVAQLNKAYPKVYHNMLRARAIPFLNQARNDYYSELYFEHQIRRELGDVVSLENRDYKRLVKMAKHLSKLENILNRAITDSDLLKFSSKKYDPQTDLKNILDGKIQIEIGNISYQELKQAAASHKQQISYQKMGYLAYAEKLDQIFFKYAAFLDAKTNEVNVCCFSDRIKDLRQIYNEKLSHELKSNETTSFSSPKSNKHINHMPGKKRQGACSPFNYIQDYCKEKNTVPTTRLTIEMDR